MWIALGIIGFLVLIISAILLLPVNIIIKSDQDGSPDFSVKVLFKTFKSKGEKGGGSKTFKDLLNANRKDNKGEKEKSAAKSFFENLKETLSLVCDLLNELVKLLGHCTAKKFKLSVVCRGDDAAAAAQKYGKYCAVIYPAAGFIASIIKVKKRGQRINVLCDYNSNEKDSFSYHFVISARVFRILGAFLKIAIKKYKK